jgi:tetratricopeptide (TPR) repeat protein
MEKVLDTIGRLAENMERSSPEEYERFLEERLAGKPVDHEAEQTPLDRAQDLADEATEAFGRRQLQLLRQALEICPDCADAYILLAERESDLERAREWYAQGMAAGERALGPQTFEENVGHFWEILETRPYMYARFGVARCCEMAGQLDEAIDHYAALLRLNPNDKQGVRYHLAGCLLRARQFEPLENLLEQYDEPTAHWRFLAALAAYAKEGNTARSRECLAEAHKVNQHVRKYLVGNAPLPEVRPTTFMLGEKDEAAITVIETLDDWAAFDGALEWLDENTRSRRRKRPRRKK